jgi:DNA mismatch repair protein MSH4
MKMNARLLDSMKDVFILTDKILGEFDEILGEGLHDFYDLSENIGLLDFLISGTLYAADCRVTCFPEFGPNFIIENSYSPILHAVKPESISPNSITSLGPNTRVFVISGANKCGKTTFLRQIGLLQIMAQMGMPVVATRMITILLHTIACRLGSDDDFENNASTFTCEMQEVARMLEIANDKSMLLIDELGRGTSVTEGTALAIAIIEELMKKEAFVLITSHLSGVKEFASLQMGMRSLHFKSVIHRSGVTHLHRLESGEDTSQGYGLALARQYNLPNQLLNYAQAFYERIVSKGEVEELLEKSLKKKKLMGEMQEAMSAGVDPALTLDFIEKENEQI